MATDRAINNNINYYKQRKTTVTDYSQMEDNQLINGLSPSIGAEGTEVKDLQEKTSLDVEGEYKPQAIPDETIPWDFVKIDLFDNSKDPVKQKLRLALHFKKKGETGFKRYNALVNSEFRMMKRGLDDATWNNPHYEMVKENYSVFKETFTTANASKCYKPKSNGNKGHSVVGLSVIISPGHRVGEYVVNLIADTMSWVWTLKGHKGHLNQAQRKKGMIATVMIRSGEPIKKLDVKDELF